MTDQVLCFWRLKVDTILTYKKDKLCVNSSMTSLTGYFLTYVEREKGDGVRNTNTNRIWDSAYLSRWQRRRPKLKNDRGKAGVRGVWSVWDVRGVWSVRISGVREVCGVYGGGGVEWWGKGEKSWEGKKGNEFVLALLNTINLTQSSYNGNFV